MTYPHLPDCRDRVEKHAREDPQSREPLDQAEERNNRYLAQEVERGADQGAKRVKFGSDAKMHLGGEARGTETTIGTSNESLSGACQMRGALAESQQVHRALC